MIINFSTELEKSSPYYYGKNITDKFLNVLSKYRYDRLFFVSNNILMELYGKELVQLFETNGIKYKVILIEDGEQNKNFNNLEHLCEKLIENNVSKDSIVITFGGGCIGNIVGLAASLVFRGIRFIEIPTTFMAITDSTLSNKQGVNGVTGKNQFGVYSNPIFIWGDVKYLHSENNMNINAAIIEGVKNGFISDSSLLDFFEGKVRKNAEGYSLSDLYEIGIKIIESKLAILRKDPTEKGYGMILEYGHTFGHAIEWLTKGRVIHGLAVAKGMCIAAELAHRLGMISNDIVDRHYYLLGEKMGVNLSIPDNITAKDMMNVIMSDNKKGARGIKYVLLRTLGECSNPDGDYQVYVEPAIVENVINDYMLNVRKKENVYV